MDAIAVDIGVARLSAGNQEGTANIVILDEKPGQSEQYGIGFKLGNTELKDQVEATRWRLKAGRGCERFMEIAKKYGLEDSVCLGRIKRCSGGRMKIAAPEWLCCHAYEKMIRWIIFESNLYTGVKV